MVSASPTVEQGTEIPSGKIDALHTAMTQSDSANPRRSDMAATRSGSNLTRVSAVSGQLSAVSVADVLQMFCQGVNCGCLIFRRKLDSGKLFIENGRIIHAEWGDLSGEEAARKLMTWTDGKFYFKATLRAKRQTIDKRWDVLLLEACQAQDEAGG